MRGSLVRFIMGMKHLLLAAAIVTSGWGIVGLIHPQAPVPHKIVFQVTCPTCAIVPSGKLHVVAQPYAVVMREAG
jgi:hypothetical protein